MAGLHVLDLTNLHSAASGDDILVARLTADSGGRFVINADGSLQWGDGTSLDASLLRDGANVLAQRNGTNAQAYRLYNTTDGAGNSEYFTALWSGNACYLQVTQSGTGTYRNLILTTGGAHRVTLDTSGHLTWVTDNTLDIGADGATRPRDIYIGGEIRTGNGAQATPSHSFDGDDNCGMWLSTTDTIAWSTGAGFHMLLDTGTQAVASDISRSWSSTTAASGAGDLFLYRDAANTLAQRNSTNPQSFRVYNTDDGAGNTEFADIVWSGNTLRFGTYTAGTGTGRTLAFATNDTLRWAIGSTGHMTAQADNTYDIGADGATRPRDLFIAGRGRGGDGDQSNPTWSFDSDHDTGIYLAGAGDMRVTVAGANFVRFVASGILPTAASIDLGASGNRFDVIYGDTLAIGATPASSGTIRVPNTGQINGRNAGDTGDVAILALNSSNHILMSQSVAVNINLQAGGALATTATVGFVSIPTCAGNPSGTPAGISSGAVAMIYDTTNDELFIYNGSWRSVALA